VKNAGLLLPLMALMASIGMISGAAHAADRQPLQHIGYDAAQKRLVGSGSPVIVKGNFTVVASPKGPAVRLDGNTTMITAQAWPRLTSGESWTVSAWLKLDAWPWNEAPIIDQSTQTGSLFFGVDAQGHLVAQRQAGATAVRLVSDRTVEPRAWMLATLSWDKGRLGFSINGKPVAGHAAPPVQPLPDGSDAPLIIGRVRAPALLYPSNAIHPLLPVIFTLDGALGDLALYDRVLRRDELSAMMTGVSPAALAPAPPRPLPRWTGGSGTFGAFRTSLAYDPAWDEPRRVGPESDVVVRFPQAPIQLIFWQGMNYIPAWVTENGRWYSDEFMEVYGKPRCPDGEDCEPMSDKQVRYSHVEILESTPARAVIHWRYALSEVQNDKLADETSPSGWGAWADEYWTVYPDGAAVRKQVLWTDNPDREASEFQESIVIMGAGERPEDAINIDALSLANLKGESKSYQWQARTATGFAKPRGPDHFTGIDDPMIQWINLKSDWKPFAIANAGPAKFEGINWEPSMSSFEWWNHWPVAQIRSSGRPALIADRPSHSSLSHIYWPIAEKDEHRLVRILMDGLTQEPAAKLAMRARSFVSPPPAQLSGAGAVRYDQSQRAFVVEGARTDRPVTISIDASTDHPLVNPAIVVPGWSGTATAIVDGQVRGAQLGYVDKLEGRTLIAYLPITETRRITVTLTPQP
jgi:hypothetical protein